MLSFPLVSRELRVQSRKRAAYDARVTWGVGAISLFAFLAWSFPNQSANGRYILSAIHLCLAVMLFIIAPAGAADAISREKREGTLGLLMLTELTATEVVLGKLAAHFIRVVYVALMMLPLIMLPVLMGGVDFQDFLLSSALLFAIAVAGLSAGVIASAVFASFGAALWSALILCAILVWLTGTILANTVFTVFPNRWGQEMPLSFRLFALGPLMIGFPMQARDFTGMFFASRWLFLVIEIGIVLLALAFLFLAVRFSARRVAQHSEFAGETKREAAFRMRFLTPVVWQGAFRRKMRRNLDRNPFIWLEYRTALARSAHSGMVLAVITMETMLLVSLPEHEAFASMNFLLLFLLVLFMTFKSSRSFQSERESGAFELLLVTPMTEDKLVDGRLRAVASYYGLAFLALTLLGGGAFLALYSIRSEEYPLSFLVKAVSLLGSTISVPICGLYFALRSRSFVPALVWTAGLAILAPICMWSAFNGMLWMWVGQQWPPAVMVDDLLRRYWWMALVVVGAYHFILAFMGRFCGHTFAESGTEIEELAGAKLGLRPEACCSR